MSDIEKTESNLKNIDIYFVLHYNKNEVKIVNRIITCFSVGTAAFALAYSIKVSFAFATIVAIASILIVLIGFKIENYIKTNGNDIINKIVYLFTISDKGYNIKSKQSTYTYNGNDSYTFKKVYEIIPTTKDLDRINDRFAWSAPSAGCYIDPTKSNHSINTIWQQESWTCYSIYFNEVSKKGVPYSVGSEISNLVDTTKCVVPFLSNTIDRKTECLTLEVIFPKDSHPNKAKYEVFSSNCSLNSNQEEELEYDSDIGGFKRIIHYPRKGWRYVISWN